MKKLFTLVALLACFLGAKAEWVVDKEIKYSDYTGFPFYVMGYVPEFVDGIMTDYGSNYRYETQATLDDNSQTNDSKWKDGESSVGTVKTSAGTEYQKVTGAGPYWHQYFIINQITTEMGGSYTVKAKVKASEETKIDLTMQWGWGTGQSITQTGVSIGTEWQEIEVDFNEIAATSCEIIAKPGTSAATIEWEYVIVGHNKKADARPVVWLEQLTNGDECAQMINKPFEKEMEGITGADVAALVKQAPSQTIDGEKVYVVNAPAVDAEAYKTKNQKGEDITGHEAWANQFFIVSPVPFKAGEIIKVEFDYKADKEANTNTQAHGQPTYYQHYELLGDVKFTTEWQHLTKEVTVSDQQDGNDGMYSIAFNLNPDLKEENTYYFKKLSICTMKLDHGYFVAGSNPDAGLDYDFDNAIEFTDGGDDILVATVGEKDAYVSQVMISTVRGNTASFKGATIKSSGEIVSGADEWLDFAAAGLAKINLPGVGIWKIRLNLEYNYISFELIEGTLKEKKPINPNPTEVVVAGTEREYLQDEAPEGYEFKKNEEDKPIYGFPWDNQFCIKANRSLKAGEAITVSFKYKADNAAKVGTQIGGADLGGWMQGEALGDIEFTSEEQTFTKTFNATEGMQTITFNMAVVKEANTYKIYDIVWKLEDGTESLIDETGSKNFNVKVAAGQFEQLGGETAIKSVEAAKKAVPAVKFNLAGQRVSNDYKGIVIDNSGKKYLAK